MRSGPQSQRAKLMNTETPALTKTKILAVRAYIGVAIRNLSALSADDKNETGIADTANEAGQLLARCHADLTDLLKLQDQKPAAAHDKVAA